MRKPYPRTADAARVIMRLLALVRFIAQDDLTFDPGIVHLGQIKAQHLGQRRAADLAVAAFDPGVGVFDIDVGMHRGLHGLQRHAVAVHLHPKPRTEDVEAHHPLLIDHDLGACDVLFGVEFGNRHVARALRGGVGGQFGGLEAQRGLQGFHVVVCSKLRRGQGRCAFQRRGCRVLHEDDFAILVANNGFGHLVSFLNDRA